MWKLIGYILMLVGAIVFAYYSYPIAILLWQAINAKFPQLLISGATIAVGYMIVDNIAQNERNAFDKKHNWKRK